MTACWLDGKLVAPEAARISLFDHGVLYGDGIFEGIRFYNGVAFRLDAHLHRLATSARAIHLALPYTRAELAAAVAAVIAATGSKEGYLRLGVTRGVGPLGLDMAACGSPSCFILSGPTGRSAGERESDRCDGVRVVIASIRRTPADCLDPRIKSLNYLNNILARDEARRAGADEAIMLNREGRVTEGTSDNLFMVRNGALFTPPISDGALDGITRTLVMELAAGLGLPCHERSLTRTDLLGADECFLTGTAIELVPVAAIDGQALAAPGPVFTALERAFRARVARETAA